MTAFDHNLSSVWRFTLDIGLLSALSFGILVTTVSAETPIHRENSRPGDSSWMLENPADREIEGYASATSINRGESLRLYVSTGDPTFTMTVYRMGWYDGAGARRVKGPYTLTGTQQPMPEPDPKTGLIECEWEVSFHLSTES